MLDDFGGIDRIAWRAEMGEGNNRLWRMTLSYLGWTVPLLARGDASDVAMIRRAIDSLMAQNQWDVPGVFRDVWHPYSASHRLINLLTGHALLRAASRLFSTLFRVEIQAVDMSVDAARKSACAT